MQIYRCDICAKTSDKVPYNWIETNKVDPFILSLEETPIQHVCPECWTAMLSAVAAVR
jgi:hypothetical protein